MDYDYVKNNGMTSTNPPTGVDAQIVIVFFSVALFNVVELLFIIYTTFKRRTGLYFWSFIVATVCIIPHSVGFLVKYFGNHHDVGMIWAGVIFFGWCGMVTGQSLVLWSRLHLVMHDRRRQRAVLIMIIVDAIICHGGVSVLIFGVNGHNPKPFVRPYAIFERLQVTVFSVQELIISGLYIYETAMLLRREKNDCRQSGCETISSSSGAGGGGEGGRTLGRIGYAAWRRVLKHLIYISIMIILLDAPLLALQYADLYDLQTSYKALVYSVKLKLEFSILNRVIEVTTEQNAARAAYEAGLEAGADDSREGGSSSRNLREVSSSKTTLAKSPRQAYEETLAQLRAETPPPMPSIAGLERFDSEEEKEPERGPSNNMRIDVALGSVGEARTVKFKDGQVGDREEERRSFPLMPFEAMAFRFDDEVDTRPRKLQRTPRTSVSGRNSQSDQGEQSDGLTSFGHQRQMRSDEGAYLRNLDEEAIDLYDMTIEGSRPATQPMGGPVFMKGRDLI
ncbi:hypothetical protein PspLS_10647 [Pyricularia sp. CBS 133598]|nr:hypothetical protein PspLS_10647 [Pyricularia sp. CBS 133598]